MDWHKTLQLFLTWFQKISDALGVKWAPASVPMNRRLQTLAAAGWICLVLFGEALGIYLAIQLLYSTYWYLGILYAVWMLNDVEICHKGGRKCNGRAENAWRPKKRHNTYSWSAVAWQNNEHRFSTHQHRSLTPVVVRDDCWHFGSTLSGWTEKDIISHAQEPNQVAKIEWVRNWAWWRYYRDYFPIKLVKTAELDPTKNYLFACFPHGLVSSGAFGAFSTNALDFYKVFPGMTCNMITLGGHFLVPFFRDLILALGACSSSRESLLHLLDLKRYQGKCVALIVGGAAEALDSHPGEYKVILSRRKGFVRVAMMSGAPLVPVFSFGEPDVFRPLKNPEDSLLRRFQEKVRQITGISPMFPVGRGLFQYSFGVVPLRAPITTIVGTPMPVQKNLEPSPEEIDAVHAEFTRRLVELFDQEKANYLPNHKDVRLVIT